MFEEVSKRVDALEVAEKQQEDVWPLASSIQRIGERGLGCCEGCKSGQEQLMEGIEMLMNQEMIFGLNVVPIFNFVSKVIIGFISLST